MTALHDYRITPKDRALPVQHIRGHSFDTFQDEGERTWLIILDLRENIVAKFDAASVYSIMPMDVGYTVPPVPHTPGANALCANDAA